MSESHLWLKPLRHGDMINEALDFVGHVIEAPGLNGPILGNRLETEFLRRLEKEEYDVTKGTADIENLNTDVKSLQVRGKRGGAPKIHGYSKGGKPTYSLLVFLYAYDGHLISVESVLFIPAEQVNWKQAEHYLFSVPKEWLTLYQVSR